MAASLGHCRLVKFNCFFPFHEPRTEQCPIKSWAKRGRRGKARHSILIHDESGLAGWGMLQEQL
eukprot:932771-Pelagomonas_calceolata.AAC.2